MNRGGEPAKIALGLLKLTVPRAQVASPLVRGTGVASLGDAKRSGRPPMFRPGAGRPGQGGGVCATGRCRLALSRWSCPELARHVVAEGICASISPATVRRWLSEDALKPWQYRSWIFITDPDFAAQGPTGTRPLQPDMERCSVGAQTIM